MYVPTTLKVIVLKGNANSHGLIPILLKFTQNRKTNRISLRKWVQPEDWLDDGTYYIRERGKYQDNGKLLNLFLRSQLSRAEEILLEYERNNRIITFSEFKRKFVKMEQLDFIAFCNKELDRRALSGDFSKETIKGNWSRLAKLKSFSKHLPFENITVSFLERYEKYLRNDLKNQTNTVFTAFKFIRTMLNIARREELTDVYPFDKYKISYQKDTRDRLSCDEVEILQQLFNSQSLTERLQRTLRYFLFVCYTGLSWKDLVSIKYENIRIQKNRKVIDMNRGKNGNRFVVPLMQQAIILLDSERKKGVLFPDIISNQKANSYIKQVITSTKIRKHVTFHVGRHTFATIALNKGIPREAIQKMLGHSSEEMTKNYSKILDSTLIREIEKWDQDFTKPYNNATISG